MRERGQKKLRRGGIGGQDFANRDLLRYFAYFGGCELIFDDATANAYGSRGVDKAFFCKMCN